VEGVKKWGVKFNISTTSVGLSMVTEVYDFAPSGLQGHSPRSGSLGAKPLKLKAFKPLNLQRRGKIYLILGILQAAKLLISSINIHL